MRPQTISVSLFILLAYVAITTGDNPNSSPIHWIQPIKHSNIHSSKILSRSAIQRGQNRAKKPVKGNNAYNIPGSGFIVTPGFDVLRVCATGYFLKNTMFALIQSLEYQKQMGMMLHVLFEGGQFPSLQIGSGSSGTGGESSGGGTGSSGGGHGSTEGTTNTTTTSTTTTTTMPPTTITTSTTSMTSSSNNSTSTTAPANQTILTPEQVQELLNLVKEILDILPEILQKFAAIEEANANEHDVSTDANDPPTHDSQKSNVIEKQQEAAQRLTSFKDTMTDFNLKYFTTKMTSNSKDLFIEIVHQAVTDLSILAPKDEDVYEVMLHYADVLLENSS